MNPRQILLVCTMAVILITFDGGWGSKPASASTNPCPAPAVLVADLDSNEQDNKEEDALFLQTLGVATEDELYEALYNGQSLAEIAESHGGDTAALVRLQMKQLSKQLQERLLSGSITLEQYLAYEAELPELMLRSVLGEQPSA